MHTSLICYVHMHLGKIWMKRDWFYATGAERNTLQLNKSERKKYIVYELLQKPTSAADATYCVSPTVY